MMGKWCIRIVLILGMVAGICGIAGAGAVGIIAETRVTAEAELPVCTAPCECISESTAAMTWGAEGYEKCSKTICGQTADGDVQFYCIHPVGATAVPSAAAPQETVVSTAAVTATPPAVAPSATGTMQKTPAGVFTVIAAIGAAALAAAGMKRRQS